MKTLIKWSDVDVFDLETCEIAPGGARLCWLREYRDTGGMYMAFPIGPDDDRSDLEALTKRASEGGPDVGPEAAAIDWTGIPESLGRKQIDALHYEALEASDEKMASLCERALDEGWWSDAWGECECAVANAKAQVSK